MKKRKNLLLMFVLTLLLVLSLGGCGKKDNGEDEPKNGNEQVSEQETETETPKITPANTETEVTPEAEQQDNAVHVTNAEELLDAIAPGAEIILEPGDYNLSEVKIDEDYFAEHPYICYGDYGNDIRIRDIDGLTIRADRKGSVEVYITDGYYDVLQFARVNELTIENIVFGHRIDKGHCDAAVLEFDYCDDILLNNVELYGCGTYGIEGYDINGLTCRQCNVHDCTYGMISLFRSADVLFDTCVFNKNAGYTMIDGTYSSIVFDNCTLAESEEGVNFVAYDTDMSVLFKGCTFGKVETENIKNYGYKYGNISFDDKCKYDKDVMQQPVKQPITVRTVEEFIEAVGPGAVILVEPGEYNISEYLNKVEKEEGIDSWNSRHSCMQIEDVFDGWEISFYYADGMSIIGKGDDRSKVHFITDPRYAAVLNFGSCSDMGIWNIMAGHTEMGNCAGNVIDYRSCSDVSLNNVDLYGCGVYGVGGEDGCGDINVFDSYIHDCESGPFDIWAFDGQLAVFNSVLTGSNGGGSYDSESGGYYFFHCVFGDEESNRFAFDDYVVTERCEFEEITEYPDVEPSEGYYDGEDIKEMEFFDKDTLKVIPFDAEAIADTAWYSSVKESRNGKGTTYYSPTSQEKLYIYDTTTACLIDTKGVDTNFTYYCDSKYSAVFQSTDKSKNYSLTLYIDTSTDITWLCFSNDEEQIWFY